MKTTFLVLITFLLSSCASTNSHQKLGDEKLTDELMKVTGVVEALDNIDQILQSDNNEFEDDEQREQAVELAKLMKKHMSADQLLKGIRKDIHTGLSKSQKLEIISWYKSKPGRTVFKSDQYLQTPEGQEAFGEWLRNMARRGKKFDKKELDFAMSVAKESGAVTLTVEMVSAVSVGMMVGMNSTLPKAKRKSKKELDEEIHDLKRRLYSAMGTNVVLQIHFAYFHQSPEFKKSYLGHLKSEAGKKFNKVLLDSFVKSFTQASKSVGKEMGRMIASTEKS